MTTFAPSAATVLDPVWVIKNSSDARELATAAETLSKKRSKVDSTFRFTIHDHLWRPIGQFTHDIISATGTHNRNKVPRLEIQLKGNSTYVAEFAACKSTMVGVTVETGGVRFAYYVDTFEQDYSKGAWTYNVVCKGIWDIFTYLQIWPDWYLPIQAQLFSHAVYVGPLVTVCENMVAEQALRIQSGLWEFINNAGSLNPDLRSWVGTLLVDAQNGIGLKDALKTPIYVVRTNPLLDTSPLIAKTVRMQDIATVYDDILRAYGVTVEVNLWLPGDPQPDEWANLELPTYVVTVKDRSNVKGPTGTVLDSVLRTVVDAGGSALGDVMEPILNPTGAYHPEGVFIAPVIGVNFVEPWTMVIAPPPMSQKKSSLVSCKITDHTPRGWQFIVGGKSPKWLNDLINATFQWLIDSLSILIGVTGFSNILDGFLNDAFLAFQLIENFGVRSKVGPYHPAMERFTATGNSPYNVETVFQFINAMWDARGYTSAQFQLRNGEVYTLGVDFFLGGLVSLFYPGPAPSQYLQFTDFVDSISYRFDQNARDVFITIGDGQAEEAPMAKVQRFVTGLQESVNTLSLAPQS